MSDRLPVKLSDVKARLAEMGDAFETLSLVGDIAIVMSAGTGRIYGPFFGEEDPVCWVSPAFRSAADFEALRRSTEWNIGAERLWLSPELEYFVRDRHDFWNTYAVPGSIDPGTYRLAKIEFALRLTTRFSLVSARTRIRQEVDIERTIAPEVSPAGLPPTIRAASYRENITIDSAADQAPVVPWIIRQMQLGGRVLIPARRGTRAQSIVGPLPNDLEVAADEGFRFSVDGGHMFKAAFPARSIAPVIAYLLPGVATSAAVLLTFDGNAGGPYFEEPPDRPGDNGYSAFVFRDDGRFGGYCELEIVGRPQPSAVGPRKRSTLSMSSTTLLGSVAETASTLKQLLQGLGALIPK